MQNCGVLRAAGVIKPPLSIESMTKSRATQNALEKMRKRVSYNPFTLIF